MSFCDQEALVRDMEILNADLPTYINKLKELAALYKGRTGHPTDADDNMELINAMMAFESLNQDIDIVLQPTFLSISDNISRAIQNQIDAIKLAKND